MAFNSSPVNIDNSYAVNLRSLHQPGNPLILANTYDTASTKAILSLNTKDDNIVKAIATTSNVIAATLGIADAELSLSQNLSAHAELSPIVRAAGLPLSMDLQDGYGDNLVEAIKATIRLGIVGVNIEDCYTTKGWGLGLKSLRPFEESVERIKTSVKVASEMGVPDFVVNARTDILHLNPVPEGWTRKMQLDEAVKRGKAFLDAGAVCVFVWGGSAGNITDEEVKTLVKAFEGMLAVKLTPGKEGLSVKELAKLGVCRISIGGGLKGHDIGTLKKTAERVLTGGQLYSGSS
jgi:2-methylisocitrate lyase-like PEP mutase family enzyme